MRSIIVLAAFHQAAVTALAIGGDGWFPLLTRWKANPGLESEGTHPDAYPVPHGPVHVEKQKRARLDTGSCAGREEALEAAFKTCSSLATKAAAAIASDKGTNLTEIYFHNTSPKFRDTTKTLYQQIAAECQELNAGNVHVFCVSATTGRCVEGLGAFAEWRWDLNNGEKVLRDQKVSLCPRAFHNPRGIERCGTDHSSLGTLLVHEMSHVLGDKQDEVYGINGCKRLDQTTAAENADSYAFFARDVGFGCNATQPPPTGDGDAGSQPTTISPETDLDKQSPSSPQSPDKQPPRFPLPEGPDNNGLAGLGLDLNGVQPSDSQGGNHPPGTFQPSNGQQAEQPSNGVAQADLSDPLISAIMNNLKAVVDTLLAGLDPQTNLVEVPSTADTAPPPALHAFNAK
ncbi:Metallopeptidase, catalytic domain protein [Metarhizium rileyi]|uniref:Metallopeptidase, catalytic domain protein n=1 Tax=Metarhizium rileyi (strain RCEF 4871) TaxID=1649241 RepID=A0A167HC14_METRR|nr:Metallopeptidase, catalytic domain protein [Metarhizium rileyi RCEF 4871]